MSKRLSTELYARANGVSERDPILRRESSYKAIWWVLYTDHPPEVVHDALKSIESQLNKPLRPVQWLQLAWKAEVLERLA